MPVLSVMEDKMIFEIIIGAILLTLALIDFEKKEVPILLILVLAVACVSFRLILGTSLSSISYGISIGGCLIAIAIITKEKIGLGDGLVVTSLGFFLGASKTIWMLFWASLIMTLVSVILLLMKKRKLGSTLPFMPAIFLGFLLV